MVQVPVLMMNMEASFSTYQDLELNTMVLILPFTNSYSMLLLMPDVMATLENGISPDHVSKWMEAKPTLVESVFLCFNMWCDTD